VAEVIGYGEAFDTLGDCAWASDGLTDKVNAPSWFTAMAATSGTRTPTHLFFLRFLIDRPSAV